MLLPVGGKGFLTRRTDGNHAVIRPTEEGIIGSCGRGEGDFVLDRVSRGVVLGVGAAAEVIGDRILDRRPVGVDRQIPCDRRCKVVIPSGEGIAGARGSGGGSGRDGALLRLDRRHVGAAVGLKRHGIERLAPDLDRIGEDVRLVVRDHEQIEDVVPLRQRNRFRQTGVDAVFVGADLPIRAFVHRDLVQERIGRGCVRYRQGQGRAVEGKLVDRNEFRYGGIGFPVGGKGLLARRTDGDHAVIRPAGEEIIGLARRGEGDSVLDRVGRRVVLVVRSAVQVIGDRVVVDRPTCGDRQILRHRVASLGAVPSGKGVAVAGKGRERRGVAVANRLCRDPVGQRSAVADESDGIGIAGIVHLEDQRAVARDRPLRNALVGQECKVGKDLLFRRNRRVGRAALRFGQGLVVSVARQVFKVVFDGIAGVGVRHPVGGKGLFAGRSDGDGSVVRPTEEGIARAGGIGERHGVLDRVGRRIAFVVGAAVQVIGDRVVDRRPAGGKGLLARRTDGDHAVIRPAGEEIIGLARRGEGDSVLDRVGRRVVLVVRSAVQGIGDRVIDRRPERRDRQIALNRGAARVVVPSRERIAVAGKGRDRGGVAVANRLGRASVGQRAAVRGKGDGIGIAGVVHLEDQRTVARDRPLRNALVGQERKVGKDLLFRRNRRVGRAALRFGQGLVVSVARQVFKIILDGIRGVGLRHPVGGKGLFTGRPRGDHAAVRPTEEGVAVPFRFSQNDRPLDGVGRGVLFVIRTAVERVGDRIIDCRPGGGKSLFTGRPGGDRAVIRPTRKRIARAGRFGERNGVFHRIGHGIRLSVGTAVQGVGDRVLDRRPRGGKGLFTGRPRGDRATVRPTEEGVAVPFRFSQHDRPLDGVGRGVLFVIRTAVERVGDRIIDCRPGGGKSLFTGRPGGDRAVIRPTRKRIARAGRFGERNGVFHRIGHGIRLSVGTAVQIITDRIVDRRPTCLDGKVAGDRRRKVVVPSPERIAGAGGIGCRCGGRGALLDRDRGDRGAAVGIERDGIGRLTPDRHGIERDALAVFGGDKQIEGVVADLQRHGFGRDRLDPLQIGADLPGRAVADHDPVDHDQILDRVRNGQGQSGPVNHKSLRGQNLRFVGFGQGLCGLVALRPLLRAGLRGTRARSGRRSPPEFARSENERKAQDQERDGKNADSFHE